MPRLTPKPVAQSAAAAAPTIKRVLHGVEEVADQLSLSRTTVFGLIRDGLLRSCKVAASEVEAFAARLQEGEVSK